MDRGAWQATVHGVTESDMTEGLTQQQITSTLLPWVSHLTQRWLVVFHGGRDTVEGGVLKRTPGNQGENVLSLPAPSPLLPVGMGGCYLINVTSPGRKSHWQNSPGRSL